MNQYVILSLIVCLDRGWVRVNQAERSHCQDGNRWLLLRLFWHSSSFALSLNASRDKLHRGTRGRETSPEPQISSCDSWNFSLSFWGTGFGRTFWKLTYFNSQKRQTSCPWLHLPTFIILKVKRQSHGQLTVYILYFSKCELTWIIVIF